MRKIIFFSLFLILTYMMSCQDSETFESVENDTVINWKSKGSWEGELKLVHTKDITLLDHDGSDINIKEGYDEKGLFELPMVFQNCGDQQSIWGSNTDGSYMQLHKDYEINALAGNNVLHKVIDGGSWVETQVWSFVELDESLMAVQWSRMVSNVAMPASDALRNYGMLAYGEFKKVSDVCELE